MSFTPQIFQAGKGPRPAKRGASGPAPSRKNTLWQPKAARKAGGLTVTCAHTGQLLSSKTANQEQLLTYAFTRQQQLTIVAAERGYNLDTAAGRRWAKRVAAGYHDRWVVRHEASLRKPASFNATSYV